MKNCRPLCVSKGLSICTYKAKEYIIYSQLQCVIITDIQINVNENKITSETIFLGQIENFMKRPSQLNYVN